MDEKKCYDWMDKSWAEDYKIDKSWKTPYPFPENIFWGLKHLLLGFPLTIFLSIVLITSIYLGDYIVGMILIIALSSFSMVYWIYDLYVKEDSIESGKPVNTLKEVLFEIGFVGDIMKMGEYDLRFSPRIKEFFSGVSHIFGNLEGIMTFQEDEYIMAQKHKLKIMDQLTGVTEPEKWVLSLSNNHSGDFGLPSFVIHRYRLKLKNYGTIGWMDEPNFSLSKNDSQGNTYKINVVPGTMWMNQRKCQFVRYLKNAIINKDEFNILFPHWNYENETYIKRTFKRNAEKLLESWDLIFGHHPHVPQDIKKYSSDSGKPLRICAFSGGNFTSGSTWFRNNLHSRGLIMRCEIGKLDNGKLAIGTIKWSLVKSVFFSERNSDGKKIKVKEVVIIKKAKVSLVSRTFTPFIIVGYISILILRILRIEFFDPIFLVIMIIIVISVIYFIHSEYLYRKRPKS